MTKTLLTPAQQRKAQQEARIVARWKAMTANPDSSKEQICAVIAQEFGCSRSRIYDIRKRNGLV